MKRSDNHNHRLVRKRNIFNYILYVKLFGFIYFFVIISLVVTAQSVESDDSVYSYYDESTDDPKDSQAPSDSLKVEIRNFDPEKLKELKADETLQYKEAPTVAESLWDRFVILIRQFFDSIFRGATTTDWGQVFTYLVGIILLVILIMMILRVNAFKIFYSGDGASTIPYSVLDENIHEMDFDKLIQDAVSQQDYRKGVRLLFLYSLKMLADKNLIHWEQGKTNHDYLDELKESELKNGFNELNHYFEYAWYGNFGVSRELFLSVQHVFTNWRKGVR